MEMLKIYQSYTSLKRYGIRCMVNSPKESYPLHRHDYFEFELIKSGAILHELNGTQEILRRGEIIALSPRDLHRLTVLEPVEIYNFCVFYKDAPSSVEKLLASVKFPRRGRLDDEEFRKAVDFFESVSDELQVEGAYDRETIEAYATLFLIQLLTASEKVSSEKLPSGYTHIVEAMKFVSENFKADLTLNEVAAIAHLAPSYFSKLFGEISGKSFVSYLTEQRIEHAKLLLATTDKSVTEIGFTSGFGSFSSFSRAFRKASGITPNEFRKHAKAL